MRRLTRHDRDDRGFVTLFVIGMITVLLVASAAAIDVSRFSQENSSAQHSADATALAVATDCVRTGSPLTGTSYDEYRKTEQVISSETPISCGSGEVRVKIEKDVDGGLMLNRDARVVHKQATVRWGSINSLSTAPVVISQCTFDLATDYGTTFPSEERIIPLGSGDEPSGGGGGPSASDDEECPDRPPGAFGWLDTGSDTSCSVDTTLNASGQLVVHGIPGTGTGYWWNCITQVGLDGSIMIPIYGASCEDELPCELGENTGHGENIWYRLLGFAEIQITGWNLQHGSPNRAGTPVPDCPGSGSTSCIRGHFVRFTTQLGSPGSGGEFGGKAIYLSS